MLGDMSKGLCTPFTKLRVLICFPLLYPCLTIPRPECADFIGGTCPEFPAQSLALYPSMDGMLAPVYENPVNPAIS